MAIELTFENCYLREAARVIDIFDGAEEVEQKGVVLDVVLSGDVGHGHRLVRVREYVRVCVRVYVRVCVHEQVRA